ncbi:MAG: cyanobacterial porin [Chitinophagaceae bacterium]|nr:cyanobacterial porin [Chitinophagaceae bacterium]MDB5223262.1 cyanobacterial porin [Chitinophagaceae bacterium]
MKSFRIILPLVLLFLFADVQGQKKKVTTKKAVSNNTVVIKMAERNFGSPSSISAITDVIESDAAYESLKNLVENYGVTITYADNTFRGKESLKRGDFIVALNAALNNLKSKMDAAGVVDTTLFNTYDRNRGGAYLTGVSQVKDLPETSIYFPAAKSLIERWGIAAPFALNKTLNANSTIPEKEVYDILRVTMGYNSAGVNPYSTAITRDKFAIVLNNAVTQKMTEINSLHTMQQAKRDAERRRQLDSLQRVDMLRKDSITKEIELRKQEAAQKEEEARKKLLEKKKN